MTPKNRVNWGEQSGTYLTHICRLWRSVEKIDKNLTATDMIQIGVIPFSPFLSNFLLFPFTGFPFILALPARMSPVLKVFAQVDSEYPGHQCWTHISGTTKKTL